MDKWNIVKFIDCLDEKEGLKTLSDNSFEMGFVDPPYNVDYKEKKKSVPSKKYKDNIEYIEYLEWCKKWFNELKRICRMVLIHCGHPNLNMWIADIEKPKGILWHYGEDIQSQDSIAHLCKMTPILIYGKLNKRFEINPVKIKNKYDNLRGNFLHPCPMNYVVVLKILKRQNPKTVLDCFMGSGTTAFCCNQLNIKYFGYEKNIDYKADIDNRLKQKSLENW